MAKIVPKQVRAVVEMIRQHLEVVRELSALKAILIYSAQKNLCPVDWEEQLKAIKTTSLYSDPGKEIEPFLARLEQDADETDLLALFERMKQGPLN